ncbi:riboflavin kinase, partial [bacterium]|nr:riboflavin kinase [bacterium]
MNKKIVELGSYFIFAAAILFFVMYRVAKLNVAFDKIYTTSIISGAGRGKRIGFPTLNFVVPKRLEHSYGIYCGWVIVEGNKYKAAFHYGPIPTFAEKQQSLEA